MSLTVFSDASFCPHTKAAGWGAWMRGDGMSSGVVMGGAIKHPMKNSYEAELAALCNAALGAAYEGLLEQQDWVMFQSDNIETLRFIYTHVPTAMFKLHSTSRKLTTRPLDRSVSEFESKVLVRVLPLLSEPQCSIYLRHVKGHSAGSGRNWVNRTCDKIARDGMLKAKSELGAS